MKKIIAAVVAAAACSGAYAYRPYDGSDAAVADPGSVEIELGASRLRQGDVRALSVPATTFTFGLGGKNEIGIEAAVDRERESLDGPYRNRVRDASIAYKHVLHAGSLQDAAGASIATECFVDLPSGSGERTGLGCTGLVSQRWDAVTTHLNIGLSRTREGSTARSLSFIAEGPEDWTWRPGVELLSVADNAGNREHSVLAGLVYAAAPNLHFDIAARVGRSSEGRVRELRVGLTWTLEPAGKGR